MPCSLSLCKKCTGSAVATVSKELQQDLCKTEQDKTVVECSVQGRGLAGCGCVCKFRMTLHGNNAPLYHLWHSAITRTALLSRELCDGIIAL